MVMAAIHHPSLHFLAVSFIAIIKVFFMAASKFTLLSQGHPTCSLKNCSLPVFTFTHGSPADVQVDFVTSLFREGAISLHEFLLSVGNLLPSPL
jgi:hypothetical protein